MPAQLTVDGKGFELPTLVEEFLDESQRQQQKKLIRRRRALVAAGALLSTVAAFDKWIREHKSPKDPAWADEKEEAGKAPDKPADAKPDNK